MATKLYLNSAAGPTYTPPTARGAWDQTANSVVRQLNPNLDGGPIATVAIAETNATAGWDVLLARGVSNPLAAGVTIEGTLSVILGVRESNAAADDVYHLHAYVTQGDSDTPRGTLLSDHIGASEWPTTAAGKTTGALALSSVAAQAGDRVVVEIGYRAGNAVATSYTGTLWYGNPEGASDLTDAGDETTLAGWLSFSTDLTFAPAQSRVTAVDAELDITNTAAKSRVTGVYAEIDIAQRAQSRVTFVGAEIDVFIDPDYVPPASSGGYAYWGWG